LEPSSNDLLFLYFYWTVGGIYEPFFIRLHEAVKLLDRKIVAFAMDYPRFKYEEPV